MSTKNKKTCRYIRCCCAGGERQYIKELEALVRQQSIALTVGVISIIILMLIIWFGG